MEKLNIKENLWLQKKEALYDLFDEQFSFSESILKKNKNRITTNLNKKKKNRAFNMWYKLPYSLLIYTPKIRFYHIMKSYLYKLNTFIIVRKQRYFYKKDYTKKNLTSFFCYRLYSDNLIDLIESIEDVAEYDISVLGLEIKDKIYTIEVIADLFSTIKKDLQYIDEYIIKIEDQFKKSLENLYSIDQPYQKNITNFLMNLQWQHIIK